MTISRIVCLSGGSVCGLDSWKTAGFYVQCNDWKFNKVFNECFYYVIYGMQKSQVAASIFSKNRKPHCNANVKYSFCPHFKRNIFLHKFFYSSHDKSLNSTTITFFTRNLHDSRMHHRHKFRVVTSSSPSQKLSS